MQGSDLAATDDASVAIVPDAATTVNHSALPGTYDSPGEEIALAITVTNTGNVTLHEIGVTEDLADAGTVDCGSMPFDLAPQEARSCTATRDIAQSDIDAGEISGFATAMGEDPGANSVGGTSTELVVVANQQPSIAVVAASTLDLDTVSQAGRADVGDAVTVVYTVANTGNVTLSAIAPVDHSDRRLSVGRQTLRHQTPTAASPP